MQPVLVKCVRGYGDKEGEEISNSLIVTESMAVSRGKRYLDDPSQGGYYQVKTRTFKVPHKGSVVVPGTWVSISNGDLNLSDTPVRVKSYSLTLTPNSIFGSLVTEEFVDVET